MQLPRRRWMLTKIHGIERTKVHRQHKNIRLFLSYKQAKPFGKLLMKRTAYAALRESYAKTWNGHLPDHRMLVGQAPLLYK